MRNLRVTKRADDMPLVGRVIREKKGQYVVMISFAQSKRHYHDELVFAPNAKAVMASMLRMYPTITFGVKKVKKPKRKRNPVAQDLRTPKYAPRVVASKRVYKRKPRTHSGE